MKLYKTKYIKNSTETSKAFHLLNGLNSLKEKTIYKSHIPFGIISNT